MRQRRRYWSDALIKATAAHYPAAERWTPPLDQIAASGTVHYVQTAQSSSGSKDEGGEPSRPRERRSRSPRAKTADTNETTNVVALKGVRDGAQMKGPAKRIAHWQL